MPIYYYLFTMRLKSRVLESRRHLAGEIVKRAERTTRSR